MCVGKLCVMIVIFFVSMVSSVKVHAQANELAQLALDIEKLAQFKGILSDLKKGYEIVSKGYGAIKDLSQGNFNIHKVFLDGLMEVSPAVKKYRKVAAIIDDQVLLIKLYKRSFSQFQSSGSFSVAEIGYISRVYDKLFEGSLTNLNELVNIVTAGKLRMSDDERLRAIDVIFADMEDKLNFLHSFNGSTSILAVQRAKARAEVGEMEIVNGVKP